MRMKVQVNHESDFNLEQVSADGTSHVMNPPPHSVWLGEGSGRGESQKISIRKNTDKQETTGQITDGEEKEEQANEFEDEEVPVSFDPVPEIEVDRDGVPRICSK